MKKFKSKSFKLKENVIVPRLEKNLFLLTTANVAVFKP